MGEGESLYGGLDRSTVYTAQSVLKLQQLLQREQHEVRIEKCIFLIAN